MNSPFHQTYNWHFEISSKCALRCPRCVREEEPGSFTQKELSLAFFQRNFTPEFLRDNVLRITFSGGLGDSIYNSQLIEIVDYLKTAHPDFQLVIVTNGSYKSRDWWTKLAAKMNHLDEVIFSIDGWNHESNIQYRINSDWESIMTGMDVMTNSLAFIRWSTLVFRFNQDHLAKIRDLAKVKGVDQFHTVLSERFGSKFYRYGNEDPLAPSKELQSPISRTLGLKEEFDQGKGKKKKSRIIYQKIDAALEKHTKDTETRYGQNAILPTCKFGYRGAFVDVEGFYYPCSWVAHPFKEKHSEYVAGKIENYDECFGQYKPRLSLHTRSLADILMDPIWKEIELRWADLDTAPIVCERKCLNKPIYKDTIHTKSIMLKGEVLI